MLFTEFTKNAINVLTNLFQQMECSVKRKMYLPVLGRPFLFSWKVKVAEFPKLALILGILLSLLI